MDKNITDVQTRVPEVQPVRFKPQKATLANRKFVSIWTATDEFNPSSHGFICGCGCSSGCWRRGKKRK